ncbi:MAG: hypothetical protein WC048_04205 [Rhizobium sp.]
MKDEDPVYMEAKNLCRTFQEWSDASTALRAIGSIPSSTLLSKPGFEDLRNAWTAARFGQAVGMSQFRLVENDPPDFEVRSAADTGKSFRHEAVEALESDRRRSSEYKSSIDRLRHSPIKDVADEFEVVRRSLSDTALKKAQKYISKGSLIDFGLVVYLNLPTWNFEEQLIQAFPGLFPLESRCFLDVWVLFQGKAYLCSDQSQMGS